MESAQSLLSRFNLLQGGYGLEYSGTPFERNYVCYSASSVDKPQLESGDKVILPPSALGRLASSDVDYPMLFELQNLVTNYTAHCGVQEFVAEEGTIFVPYWIMENLLLADGDLVNVKSVKLPKGTYIKMRPQQKGFLNTPNPESVLKSMLNNFSCMTVGHNIMVAYNNKEYYIDIIEAKPAAAICIIDTDCEVEIVPPVDNKKAEHPAFQVEYPAPAPPRGKVINSPSQRGPRAPPEENGFVAVEEKKSPGISAYPKDASGPVRAPVNASGGAPPVANVSSKGVKVPADSNFKAFTGVSRRLNEKPSKAVGAEGNMASNAQSASKK